MENSPPATKADIQQLHDSLARWQNELHLNMETWKSEFQSNAESWKDEMIAAFASHIRDSEERIGIVIENAVKDVSAAAFDRVDQLEDKVASHDRRIVHLETKLSMA